MFRLKIGASACFFHSDPKRPVFKGKTLLYLEQSLAHWVMSSGHLLYMIPSVESGGKVSLEDFAESLDGLILQGGSDVSPTTYGEKALKPEWEGDAVRDRYEIGLLREFTALHKPVLGICRGAQLINVAQGGTLYQDVATQVPKALNHRNWDIYDANFHSIRFEPGSKLASLYPRMKSAKVNTVHHQAVKALGKNLLAEAVSDADGIIEAVRWTGPSYMAAVQWHPEFQIAPEYKDAGLLDCQPILQEFITEIQNAKNH